MKVGDIVQIRSDHPNMSNFGETKYVNMRGVVIEDHSPQRPLHVGRVMDVMWENGDIEDMYTQDLEVISENW